MLAYDALYRCAGLGAYTVKQHFDFQGWFQAVLAPALEALDSTMRAREQQVHKGYGYVALLSPPVCYVVPALCLKVLIYDV